MSDNLSTKADVLTGTDNWLTWATDTKLILQKEGLVKVLDDQEPPPIGGHVYNQEKAMEDFDAWMHERHPTPDGLLAIKQVQAGHAEWKNDVESRRRKWFSDNNLAVSLIYDRCSLDIQKLVSTDISAQSVWKKLSDTYSRPDFGQVLGQVQAIRGVTYTDCEGVDDFGNQILSLRTESRMYDTKLNENFWAALAVIGLGQKFHSLTQDLLSRDTVTLEEVLARAKAEEHVIQPTNEVLALDSVVIEQTGHHQLAAMQPKLVRQVSPELLELVRTLYQTKTISSKEAYLLLTRG